MSRKLGVKCSTSNCGSKPPRNKKNDKISQKPSRNKKNNVKAQPRKVNKLNRVAKPVCDVDVKHSLSNANSEILCASCNKSMFDDVHDKCLLDFVHKENSHSKSAKKHKKQNIWKPTGHVFTKVGYKWKPTGRTFTLVGNSCPLTRFTTTNVVPSKQTTSHSDEIQKPEIKVYCRKPKNVKTIGSNKKAKIVESKNANHSEPNQTWGSNAIDIPSYSSLVMIGCPDCTLIRERPDCKDYGVCSISEKHFLHSQFRSVDLLSGSRDTNLYTISLDDMLPSSPICLLSKASKTKSWLWHRRLSHLNFGTLNKLDKDGLARGIPRLKFQKDHLCSACALGKSKKSSHQPKAEDTNQEKLYLLHMDLCGPMRVASINGKRYILVIVDDYSRFTWVRFLKTKDEAPAAIIKCIKNIQVHLKATVQNVRTDNGTEFVNQTLREWRNRTLVEAARTMLIFSRAPLFLWAEAINTACYTQNRSLIRHRYNKTPYELMQDKKPDLSFFHVFGSLCYPTNDHDDLGKFDAKADIGIFVGLVSNPVSQQPCIPPIRDDWDHLFQPMFDEYFNPPPISISLVQEVVALRVEVLAKSLVSTSIDQDAPSTRAGLKIIEPGFELKALKMGRMGLKWVELLEQRFAAIVGQGNLRIKVRIDGGDVEKLWSDKDDRIAIGCPDCTLVLLDSGTTRLQGLCGMVTISWEMLLSQGYTTWRALDIICFRLDNFCECRDLEVHRVKTTCFIRNLEGVDLLSGSRDTNLYIISLDDMLRSSPICFLSKASKTKSWLWHRRLSYLNFGTLNKQAGYGTVDYHISTSERSFVFSMCIRKRYILVIVDDYSRFTWVRFLKTKDEAPAAIIKCIKNIQVRLKATVRNVRTDNGTEFVNQTLREWYENVGITHQTSVARTPQQNGVVERRNQTLVEAARTMLIFSKASLFL
ncbi:retrovirus-related pol polyprotein from transposon TNT 1-94 [Tanacetum coccineum]